MKLLKLLSLLPLFFSLLSCEHELTFKEPQPDHAINLSKFPNHLFGQYFNQKRKSGLIIGEKSIQINYYFDIKIPYDQNVFNTFNSLKEQNIRRIGDSLIITGIQFTDTLFQLNSKNLLRKLNGHYYLNKRIEEDTWEVYTIQLDKENVNISKIIQLQPFEELLQISETPKDTVPLMEFPSSNKLLKKFNYIDFIQSETFTKQK